MSLLTRLKPKGPNGLGHGSTAEEVTAGIDLSGKTVLLTGCNAGLGKETLRVLSLRGAHVIAAARTLDKAKAACAAAMGETTPVACELTDPASIRACHQTVTELGRPLDAIICNAAIMALPTLRQHHGIEAQFFTNHVGHFVLVTGLLPQLADDGRVVMVSSSAHYRAPRGGIQFDNLSGEHGYGSWTAYGQSKLANLLFARELSKRLPKPQQTANAVHPGVIRTELGRHMPAFARAAMGVVGPVFFKDIPQGAATQCYLASHPAMATANGQYFADCNEARTSAYGRNQELAARLWETTEQIVAGL